MCKCCFSNMKSLSVSLRNSAKELSTSVTCLLSLGPISVKKEFNQFLPHPFGFPIFAHCILSHL